MNTTTLCLAGLICVPLLLPKTYSYEIEEVDALEVGAGVEVEIRCGDMNKLEISADSEDDFRMSFKNKKLKITGKINGFFGLFFSGKRNDVTADLTLKTPPHSIEVHSGSGGYMKKCFENEGDLDLSASSGSSFELDGATGFLDRLEVDLSSGSSVAIGETFHVNHIELEASSGSEFEADDEIIIETAEVRVSSGASAEICGALAVSGRVSSGGDLKVSKNTIRTDLSVSSGGRASNCR